MNKNKKKKQLLGKEKAVPSIIFTKMRISFLLTVVRRLKKINSNKLNSTSC